MISAIRLGDVIKKIDGPWSPVEVARVNDQVARMSLVKVNTIGTNTRAKTNCFMFIRERSPFN